MKFVVLDRSLKSHCAVLVAIVLAMAGCGDGDSAATTDVGGIDGGGGDVGVEDASTDNSSNTGPATPSHVSRAVSEAVDRHDHQAWRGRSWNISPAATLPEDWIVEIPPAQAWGGSVDALSVVTDCEMGASGCDSDFGLLRCDNDSDCTQGGSCQPLESTVTSPDQSPQSLCVGHSWRAYEVFYQAIAEAEEVVDVTSLYPPDGPFLAALRNGLTYLDNAGRSPRIRFSFASIIFDEFDVDEVLDELTRDLSSETDLDVAVGTYREGFESWNHSKIVAIDGRSIITGGMNMSTNSYLRDNPVFDLTMRLEGPPAVDGHAFADRLWSFICDAQFVGEFGHVAHATHGDTELCPTGLAEALEASPASGQVWVASLGRLGNIGPNVADDAIVAALDSAQRLLRLSLQDLGPLQIGPLESNAWPTDILDVMARAIGRGVAVDLLVTTPVTGEGGGSGDEGAYSNGWTKRDVIDRVAQRLAMSPQWLIAHESADEALCEQLNVAAIRPYEEVAWPDGEAFANHAKSFIVDDQAFYIGSHNLYPADLAEFGFLVDDASATQHLVESYWEPLWNLSQSEIDDACL